jgi:hypothetical protein
VGSRLAAGRNSREAETRIVPCTGKPPSIALVRVRLLSMSRPALLSSMMVAQFERMNARSCFSSGAVYCVDFDSRLAVEHYITHVRMYLSPS